MLVTLGVVGAFMVLSGIVLWATRGANLEKAPVSRFVLEHTVKFLPDPQMTEVLRLLGEIMADLSRVTSEVTEMRSASQASQALLGELAQMIRDNVTDQAALNDLADQLDAEGTALAAAVVANTPAADEPPVEG